MPSGATAASRQSPARALFVATIGVSAALLFSIQPIYARMILPALGGAPAVWTTAMLFFQCALLAGYAYAHLLVRLLSPARQVVVHGIVTLGAMAALPLALPHDWRVDAASGVTAQTLSLLAAGVGLPFFALSANAPLLQKWFAASGTAGAADPYFLYAASNAGSAAALVAFAFVVEPAIGVGSAALGWSAGYILLAGLLAGCARTMIAGADPASPVLRTRRRAAGPGLARLAAWAAIAFLPSSLMLGVTQLVTTDVGAFPLLWIAPLGLYLLSFVMAFSGTARVFSQRANRFALVLGAGCLVLALAGRGATPVAGASVALLFAGFFAVACAVHRRLYESRPDEAGLTAFYLALSAGGALGGVFNAVVAPVAFDGPAEFPMILAATGLALAGWTGPGALIRDTGAAVLALVLIGAAVAAADALGAPSWLAGASAFAALAALASRPVAHALAALAVATAVTAWSGSDAVMRGRSFFGVYAVHDHPDQGQRAFSHGSTIHGAQFLSERGGRPTPIAYYHAAGPIGATLSTAPETARIGIVGLGVGAVACHAKPGQPWTFFEIDPLVDRIARDPALFDYMTACAGSAPTVIGDARLTLADRPADGFDVLLIDAYSSDAVPIHLMTTEALELYLSRLSPEGVVLLHLSNRHLDLARIAGRGAAAVGAPATLCRREAADGLAPGESPSVVAALSRVAAALPQGGCWTALADDGGRPWTDDAASLLHAL